MTRWTPTDDILLRKFHAEGASDRDMADRLGRSADAVAHRRAVFRLPCNIRDHPKKMHAADVSLARELHRQGISLHKIARQLGRGVEQIRLACKDLIAQKTADRQTLNDRIISLRVNGKLTTGEIALKLHLSRNSIIGVLHRNGIAAPGYYTKRPRNGKNGNRTKPNIPTVTRDPYMGEWPKGCQYPSGEGAGLKWCDEPKQTGKPYCQYHEQVCHKPREEMLEAAE